MPVPSLSEHLGLVLLLLGDLHGEHWVTLLHELLADLRLHLRRGRGVGLKVLLRLLAALSKVLALVTTWRRLIQ